MSAHPTIPARVLRALKAVEGTEDVMTYEGVTVLSPRGGRPYWRVKFHWQGKAYEMSGGRTYESAWCAIEAMSQKRLSLRLQQEGRPEKSFKTVAQMVEDYQANLGPQGDWSGDTLRDRTSDFKQLIEIGKGVPCDTLTNHHLRRYIDTAPTAARAKHLTGVLKTLLGWGSATGYLTDHQATCVASMTWKKPTNYIAIPTRRDQAKTHDPLPSGAPRGNVPSHLQVSA